MAHSIVIENASGEVVFAVADDWKPGEAVAVGVWRQYDGQFYACLQAHTTQNDWTPDVVPALWVLRYAPGVIPDWVQPTGAHDAYNIGDKVRFEGKVYESVINANTWSPAVYPAGWKEVI